MTCNKVCNKILYFSKLQRWFQIINIRGLSTYNRHYVQPSSRSGVNGLFTNHRLQSCSCSPGVVSSLLQVNNNWSFLFTPVCGLSVFVIYPTLKCCPKYNYTSRRWRKKKSGAPAPDNSEEDSSDESDEEEEDDPDEEDVFFEEDEDFPNNYKHVKKYLKSPRVDAIVGGAFGISRNKAVDYFLESKIRLNGEKVLQKSKPVAAGDYLDLISELVDDGTKMKVKRVRVLSVSKDKSLKDKRIIRLRVWKANVVIDNYDAGKYKAGR